MSRWDVSNVRDMSYMFDGCTSLQNLGVSGWDVSNVRDMSYMFDECTSLQNLDVSRWDVSNVKDMRYMFFGCKSLHTDIRMWKIITNNVNNMYHNAPRIKHN